MDGPGGEAVLACPVGEETVAVEAEEAWVGLWLDVTDDILYVSKGIIYQKANFGEARVRKAPSCE